MSRTHGSLAFPAHATAVFSQPNGIDLSAMGGAVFVVNRDCLRCKQRLVVFAIDDLASSNRRFRMRWQRHGDDKPALRIHQLSRKNDHGGVWNRIISWIGDVSIEPFGRLNSGVSMCSTQSKRSRPWS